VRGEAHLLELAREFIDAHLALLARGLELDLELSDVQRIDHVAAILVVGRLLLHLALVIGLVPAAGHAAACASCRCLRALGAAANTTAAATCGGAFVEHLVLHARDAHTHLCNTCGA
jgi:hypothetical protein